MDIYCCGCEEKIVARLTSGAEIYPHRKDLSSIPMWICDQCGNYVGCHHKTKNRTNPLGCIPTREIMELRKKIHRAIDPIWKSGTLTRREVYQRISNHIGRKYHTANIRTMDEGAKVLVFAERMGEEGMKWIKD